MDRRNFIKHTTLASIAGVTAPELLAHEAQPAAMADDASKRQFRFNKNGKFKILQLTDSHYVSGSPASDSIIPLTMEMIDLEKPDLIIHTGDILAREPAEPSMREFLKPLSDRKIPFIVALGNHDSEYDRTRSQLLEIMRSYPYNINGLKKEGLHGETNDVITLYSAKGDKLCQVFYIFDSLSDSTNPQIPGYDHIHLDQILWYQDLSDGFTRQNGGKPVPSMAFFHIPLYAHKMAYLDDNDCEIHGSKGENVGSPWQESGLFVTMKEQGDVKAIFVGHDHDSDCVMRWRGMFFVYGRYSGGDDAYHHLNPCGARVIELTEGEEGFRSWIRLHGGEVIQQMHYPNDFGHR